MYMQLVRRYIIPQTPCRTIYLTCWLQYSYWFLHPNNSDVFQQANRIKEYGLGIIENPIKYHAGSRMSRMWNKFTVRVCVAVWCTLEHSFYPVMFVSLLTLIKVLLYERIAVWNHSYINCLWNSLFRLKHSKHQKPCIAVPLWLESGGESLKKGQ